MAVKRFKSSNKKVRGATKITYGTTIFDSKLELFAFLTYEANNLNLTHHPKRIILVEGFRFDNIHFYPGKDYQKDKSYIRNTRKFTSMTIQPDFFKRDEELKYIIIIDTKGYSNDVYPYKRKILFDKLVKHYQNYEVLYIEPPNQKGVRESVVVIKDFIKDMKVKKIKEQLEKVLSHNHYKKDLGLCLNFLENRNFEGIIEILYSIEISLKDDDYGYIDDAEFTNLYSMVTDYNNGL